MKTRFTKPNQYRSRSAGTSNFGEFLHKLRDALTIAGGTLGLSAFMFVLYFMVILSGRILQPLMG